MILREKIWDVLSYDREKAAQLAAELNTSPLVTGLLLERGLNGKAEMADFLYGSRQPFHDPFLMKGMAEAARRLIVALEKGEKITVYGDYDVDGITATSLLYLYLTERGGKVDTYIPSRHSEGYGLNAEALQNIAERGTALLLTVDCGISCFHEVEQAPKNLDIIITDHHTVPPLLPPALSVINPKQPRCPYPFKELSGVGLAFKLCQALEKQRGKDHAAFEKYTELAALGTVADIVPLQGENRELVRRGLKAMASTELIGLKALMAVSGCPDRDITAEHISFVLAPRINAVGRLEEAQRAVDLLTSRDRAEAEEIAAELNAENAQRQNISRSIQIEAEELLAKQEKVETAIILASEEWHSGVIGIVASHLADKYHLPTLLFNIKDGVAKGSCRSIPALDLYRAIAAEKDLLTQLGGHHQAAGLTLPLANLKEFKRRFLAYVKNELKPEDYLPHQTVDCLLGPEDEITVRDLDALTLLEPCGCGNPTPIFAFDEAEFLYPKAMGRDGNHLKVQVRKGKRSYDGVMWNRGDLAGLLGDNPLGAVAFEPHKDEWQGTVKVQLQLLAVKFPLTIYDLRRRPESKEKLLRQLCREANGATVLLREPTTAALGPGTRVQNYEELQPNLWDSTLVLYDVPPFSFAVLRNSLTCKQRQVVLLYKEEDCKRIWEETVRLCPTRNELVAAYKGLRKILQERELSFEAAVAVYSPAALAVFKELGLVAEAEGRLKLASTEKRELENSALYREGLKRRQKAAAILKEVWEGSTRELSKGRTLHGKCDHA